MDWLMGNMNSPMTPMGMKQWKSIIIGTLLAIIWIGSDKYVYTNDTNGNDTLSIELYLGHNQQTMDLLKINLN